MSVTLMTVFLRAIDRRLGSAAEALRRHHWREHRPWRAAGILYPILEMKPTLTENDAAQAASVAARANRIPRHPLSATMAFRPSSTR